MRTPSPKGRCVLSHGGGGRKGGREGGREGEGGGCGCCGFCGCGFHSRLTGSPVSSEGALKRFEFAAPVRRMRVCFWVDPQPRDFSVSLLDPQPRDFPVSLLECGAGALLAVRFSREHVPQRLSQFHCTCTGGSSSSWAPSPTETGPNLLTWRDGYKEARVEKHGKHCNRDTSRGKMAAHQNGTAMRF